MIAAVSSAVSAVLSRSSQPSRRAGTASKTGWAFQPLPNLNRETRQQIGRLRAGWTFAVICTELGYAVHKGRATWDQQRLGIGLRALARESGQSLGKVRRDCRALADLGIVVVHRPKVLHTADPATGQITAKAKGRCEETLIYLTITPSVLRPAKVHRDTGDRSTVAPPQGISKVHRGTTVREVNQTKNTPAGGADRVGTPAAETAGLTAGEAPAPIMPVNAGRDEPPIPAGRIVPSPRPQAAPAGRRRSDFPEDHAGPQAFTGEAADAFERTRRRLEAERRHREAQEAAAAPPAVRHDPPQAAAPPPRSRHSAGDYDHEAAKASVLAALSVT